MKASLISRTLAQIARLTRSTMRWRDFSEENAVEGRGDFLAGAGIGDELPAFCAARSFLYAGLLGPGMDACFLVEGLTNRMTFSLVAVAKIQSCFVRRAGMAGALVTGHPLIRKGRMSGAPGGQFAVKSRPRGAG